MLHTKPVHWLSPTLRIRGKVKSIPHLQSLHDKLNKSVTKYVTVNSNKNFWMCLLYKGKQFASNWKWFWVRSAILDNNRTCRRPADKKWGKKREGGNQDKIGAKLEASPRNVLWNFHNKWGFVHQYHAETCSCCILCSVAYSFIHYCIVILTNCCVFDCMYMWIHT